MGGGWGGGWGGAVKGIRVFLPSKREIGVYWYLLSNHCSRRCIYVEFGGAGHSPARAFSIFFFDFSNLSDSRRKRGDELENM